MGKRQMLFGLALGGPTSPPDIPAASQGFQVTKFHREAATPIPGSSPQGPVCASPPDASVPGMWANTILALGSRVPRYVQAPFPFLGSWDSMAVFPHLCPNIWLHGATPRPPHPPLPKLCAPCLVPQTNDSVMKPAGCEKC